MATLLTIASTRFNAGVTKSANFTIPTAITAVKAAASVSATNATNTADSFTMALLVNIAGTFTEVGSLTWTGSAAGTSPSLTIATDGTVDGVSVATLQGLTAQVQLNCNNRITMSVTVTSI